MVKNMPVNHMHAHSTIWILLLTTTPLCGVGQNGVPSFEFVQKTQLQAQANEIARKILSRENEQSIAALSQAHQVADVISGTLLIISETDEPSILDAVWENLPNWRKAGLMILNSWCDKVLGDKISDVEMEWQIPRFLELSLKLYDHLSQGDRADLRFDLLKLWMRMAESQIFFSNDLLHCFERLEGEILEHLVRMLVKSENIFARMTGLTLALHSSERGKDITHIDLKRETRAALKLAEGEFQKARRNYLLLSVSNRMPPRVDSLFVRYFSRNEPLQASDLMELVVIAEKVGLDARSFVARASRN
jgi:hypothetical protein